MSKPRLLFGCLAPTPNNCTSIPCIDSVLIRRDRYLTPHFQLIIVLVSMPLPLLFALWAITKGKMRQHVQDKVSQQELTDVKVAMMNTGVNAEK